MTKKPLTREELYELVWSKTMRDAAATVSVSDVALKKRCRREGVPVPPQGYWNKVRAGHRLPKRPDLPPPPAKPAAASGTRRATSKAPGKPSVTKAGPEKSGGREKRSAPMIALAPKRPQHRYDLISYVLEIEHWEWDYDFGVRWSFHRTYEVTDYAHLKVYGTVISPERVAGRRIELTFIPERRGAARYPEIPDWIGDLRRAGRGKDLEAILPVPADMLPPVLAALSAGRLNYVSLEGEPKFRPEAGVRHYTFQRALMDDDLPAVATPWPAGKPLPDLRRRILGR